MIDEYPPIEPQGDPVEEPRAKPAKAFTEPPAGTFLDEEDAQLDGLGLRAIASGVLFLVIAVLLGIAVIGAVLESVSQGAEPLPGFDRDYSSPPYPVRPSERLRAQAREPLPEFRRDASPPPEPRAMNAPNTAARLAFYRTGPNDDLCGLPPRVCRLACDWGRPKIISQVRAAGLVTYHPRLIGFAEYSATAGRLEALARTRAYSTRSNGEVYRTP